MNGLDPRMIARALGGDVTGRNSCNVPGPGHSKNDRSLSIKVDPAAPLGFRVNSFSQKDDWQTCRDYVCAALGLKAGFVPHIVPTPRNEPESAPSAFPMQLWSEAIGARDTLAEKYLRMRGLVLPDNCHDVIRFHPTCPFGVGTRRPCMIALYRDIRSNKPKAIHRTALTPEGEKIDRKVLGPKAGCAIKINADADVSQGLTIGEGIETSLAGIALNFLPVWALGDANEISKFPVLSAIECLTILVDNDVSGTGQASARECSRRWTSEGREVFRVVPAAIGQDMADIVRGRAVA
jgi:putative DNA primase/helicase